MVGVVSESLGRFFGQAQRPVLFLGAGISARAGLPDWKTFVEKLAQDIVPMDGLSAQMMRNCVRAGNFPLAIEYFRLSPNVREGDKQQMMVRLLSNYDASAIVPVAKLPVRACLTTNFDRSILDAFASTREKSALDFRLGDASFKQAQWEENLFVARIHGAVEFPESMILSKQQFDALSTDEKYYDLLRNCFVHRNVVFLGFSFYDPEIRFVLEELNRRFGPSSPGRHIALVPTDTEAEFLQKAQRLNIEVVGYDPADKHAELWRGINEFAAQTSKRKSAATHGLEGPFASTRRYLAACYARARAQGASVALREAVTEGIISALLQEVAPKPILRADLVERVRVTIGIRGREAEDIVDEAVRSLMDSRLCRKVNDESGRESRVIWIGEMQDESNLRAAIGVLTGNFRNRAYLQENWKPSEQADQMVSALFNQLIVRRGWDLGAAFASGRPPDVLAVGSLVSECASGLPAFDRERMRRVIETMFQSPSEEEAAILREIGRVSFALELAFQSPRTVFLQKAILPRSLYFDASVLMPAIVTGHPFSEVYSRAINRLREAAAAGAVDLRTRVANMYLNEIIRHRELAEKYASELGVSFPDYARIDAAYHGVTNVNVFVGAYANTYNQNPGSFSEFLDSVAPYRTEAELRKWLEEKGFYVVDAVKDVKYARIYSSLESTYAGGLIRGKQPILIEHDALQLALLDNDLRRGERALFVTADRALHEATLESRFSDLTGMMLSHVALVQFIDLLLGGIVDGAAVAELLWSARISDRAMAVRSYFTSRGLEQYDDALALEMPRMVERFADIANRELDRTGSDLDAEDPKARAAAVRNLGMLERNYLDGMREAVEKLRGRIGDGDPNGGLN